MIMTLSLLTFRQKKQYLSMVLLSLADSLFGVVSVFIMAFMIAVIANPTAYPPSWLWSFVERMGLVNTERTVMFLAFVLAAVFLLKSILCRLFVATSNRFINDNWQLLSQELFEFFIREDFLTHCKRNTPDIINALNADTQNYFFVLKSIQEIVVNTVTLLLLLVLLAIADKLTALIILLLVPILFFTLYVFQRKKARLYGEKERETSIRLLSCGSRVMGAWREVRVQQRTEVFIAKYCALAGEAVTWRKKRRAQSNITEVAQNLLTVGLFAGLAALLMMDVEISLYIPQLSLLLLSLLRVFPSVRAINQGLNNIATYTASCDNLLALWRQRGNIRPTAAASGAPLSFDREIRASGINFAYPGTQHLIFHEADMVIPAGATVAIVGKSGMGKTTLADLLLGLLKPNGGQILYDGVDIAALENPDLSRIVSYVPQIIYLNGDTILNNIVFEQDEEPDIARVWKCLELASLKSMVEALPEGLDTVIGEGGALISGGQRQRIALARALYRDFKLLVMDESMSSLDRDTESAILDSIRTVAKDRTLLIITHRMETAKRCDMIYHVRDAKVIAGGLLNDG